jgi:hypothetical protein
MIVAVIALVVAAVALIESTGSRRNDTTATSAVAPTTVTVGASTPADAASSTVPAPSTPSSAFGGLVQVPNVMRLPEKTARALIANAGFQVNVEMLPLSSVPPGYVLTQSPLPETGAPSGSTVNLQVSARA